MFWIIIWAVGANWLAYRKGYYQFPKNLGKNSPSLTHIEFLGSFGLYLIIGYLLAPRFAKFLLSYFQKTSPQLFSLSIPVLCFMQFCIMLITFLILQSFLYQQNSILYRKIWKNKDHPKSSWVVVDFAVGIVGWVLSFPIVSIINGLLETLIKKFVDLGHYEQLAVKFVKTALSSPACIFLALSSVIILAPLIEEFLFRGVLQTHLKKHLGRHAAIILSALAFSFFHFALSQGYGNISLLISLFTLGGFLGFLYEKQGSLWSPIALHMTFNTVSALRIIFLPEVLTT